MGQDHTETAGAAPGQPLSLGKPAALAEPPGARTLGSELADLAGCEAGVAGPSTLHLLWDLAGFFARGGFEFAADEECYPISRWALERAAALGSRVRWFRHHDADSLRTVLRTCRRRPVVVTDGLCPACGTAAPLGDYLSAVRERAGWLLIDDTQPLGILGERERGAVYGKGGGGSLRFHGIDGPDLLVAASLAKAFGTPLACLLGPARLVSRFQGESETRVHCSPPAIPVIGAGLEALRWNRIHGDMARARLVALVRQFRSRAFGGGWSLPGGVFPVQTIEHPEAVLLQQRLLSRGIRTFVRRPHVSRHPRLGLIITARHRPEDLARLVGELDRIQPWRHPHGQRAII